MPIPARRFALACSLLLLALPAQGADLSVESTTMLRLEQLDTGDPDKKDLRPLTQFLGMDARQLADGNLSLHLYGWARGDLGDESFGTSKTAGDLSYGYLRYRLPGSGSDLRAGRFTVREGIVHEHLDGVAARAALPLGFELSAFGGATVHTRNLVNEESDGKGDYLAGGRLGFQRWGLLDAGISGVYEGAAPTLVNHVNGNNRRVGLDLRVTPHPIVEVIGQSTYNPETSRFAEHRYQVNLRATKELLVSGEFSDSREQSLYYSWAWRSGAAINPDDTSQTFGLAADYMLPKGGEVSLAYKHYRRNLGSANRIGGEVKGSFLEGTLRPGLGYYYLQAADGFAIAGTDSASYHNLRLYLLHDTKTYFSSIEGNGQFFSSDINGEGSALEGIFSVGYHIAPGLSVSGEAGIGRNPDYKKETRALIRLSYDMTYRAGGKQ